MAADLLNLRLLHNWRCGPHKSFRRLEPAGMNRGPFVSLATGLGTDNQRICFFLQLHSLSGCSTLRSSGPLRVHRDLYRSTHPKFSPLECQPLVRVRFNCRATDVLCIGPKNQGASLLTAGILPVPTAHLAAANLQNLRIGPARSMRRADRKDRIELESPPLPTCLQMR